MFSYVFEFDLRHTGSEAEEYLTDVARSWPPLFESLPGVQGTLLLANAFALGGEFTYGFRIDIERLSTLAVMDEALKSDDHGWRRARRSWLHARTRVRGRVAERVAGAERYCATPGTDGMIHYVISHPAGDRTAPDAAAGSYRALAFQRSRPVLGSAPAGDETWLRLPSLSSLDEVVSQAPELAAERARVFGEIREIDGAFFSGA